MKSTIQPGPEHVSAAVASRSVQRRDAHASPDTRPSATDRQAVTLSSAPRMLVQRHRLQAAFGSALQRRSAGPRQRRVETGAQGIVQRVLDVNNPITLADINTVTKVDAKVWVLEGHAHDKVVIKIENPLGETQAEFTGRHEYITWLALNTALAGVPGATALAPGELNVLSALALPEAGGKGVPTLQSCAANPHGLVFIKVAHVQMGKHLQKRIDEARERMAKGGRGFGQQQGALVALINAQARVETFGQIALFDLVVNNADRFRPEGTVNTKNLDFDAADQPIAIDNLDPNNKIDVASPVDQWDGRNRATTKAGRSGYAAQVIGNLFEEAGMDANGVHRNDALRAIGYFRTGMNTGVANLKAQEAALRGKAVADPDPHRQAIGNRLADRIQALQP